MARRTCSLFCFHCFRCTVRRAKSPPAVTFMVHKIWLFSTI
jgi:hypothetical protein